MSDIVIAGATRTAIGKFGGALAKVPAPELGATVIRALLAQSGLKPDQISEVILGQVLTAGSGQNPARQALIKSGLPKEVPAMTINVVCGSGLKAVMLAAQAVKCGDADIVIAGGQENMSASPHVLPGLARRLSHGRREARRHDDRRRPVGRVQPVPHGPDRRERRQAARHLPRAAGRVRGGIAEQGREGAEGRRVQGRDHARDDSAAQGRSGRVRQRRVHQGRGDARVDRGTAARLRQGRIGHRRQCIRPQRRRGGGAGDDRRARGASSASRRSRRSRRTRRRASIRRSWAWVPCRRPSGASRRPDGSRATSTSWRSTRRSRRRRAR